MFYKIYKKNHIFILEFRFITFSLLENKIKKKKPHAFHYIKYQSFFTFIKV